MHPQDASKLLSVLFYDIFLVISTLYNFQFSTYFISIFGLNLTFLFFT